jgi:hypothetical protein
MKQPEARKPKPGTRVVITNAPPDLLLGMTETEQSAIAEILEKPVLLVGYDADCRAELSFRDRNKSLHFIYLDPAYIKPAK